MPSETDSEAEGKTYRPVRDRRGRAWFWQNNTLYDEMQALSGEVVTFAAVLGPSAVAVYNYLCRRADEETQSCFPSIPLIAWMTGLTDPTVIESLHLLEDHGLITREHREDIEGDPTSNLYTLLPVTSWSLGGGQFNLLPPNLTEKQKRKREKLAERKLPRAVKKKFVDNLSDYRGQNNLPPALNLIVHPGQLKRPPISTDQALSGQAVLNPTSQQQHEVPVAAVVGNANAFNGEQSPTSISNSSLPQNMGGPAAEVESEWTPALLEQVAARLLGLRTGCSKAAFRRYLTETTPAHAAFVAEHFPNEPENDDAHWVGRKGSRAAALVTRLRDVEWEPRSLQAKRRQDERKAQARAVAARRVEEEAEAARRKTEESEYVRKQAVEAMRQFGSMPKKTRAAILTRVRERAAWLMTRAPDGDLEKIVVGSQLWMSLAATTQVAMREIALEKPQLPGLAQLAAGEAEHEYSSDEPSENIIEPPPLASDELAIRLIERLATGIRDGVYDLDEIAEQREKNLLDGAENDALWTQVESGIRERLAQEKAA